MHLFRFLPWWPWTLHDHGRLAMDSILYGRHTCPEVECHGPPELFVGFSWTVACSCLLYLVRTDFGIFSIISLHLVQLCATAPAFCEILWSIISSNNKVPPSYIMSWMVLIVQDIVIRWIEEILRHQKDGWHPWSNGISTIDQLVIPISQSFTVMIFRNQLSYI